MRRRGGFSIFTLLFMFYLLDFVFGAAEAFFPLLVMGIIFYSFYKLFTSIFNTATGMNNSYRTTYKTNTRTTKSSKNAAIDKVLAKYYQKNVALILFDDVSISTQNGTYTTVDNLYVNYKNEKVCKLSELKSYYPGAYDKIINALAELAKKGGKVVEEKKEEEKKTTKKAATPAEQFIDNINNMNQGINNEEITNGLYQTCDLLKQIDVVDREDGKVDPKLNKLYEYYLPILEGILKDYKRLSDSPAKTDEFKKTETQLIKTIKLINEALKTIYGSLHESDYMNLNADINTLQSLLKQDGLVDMFKGE